MSVTVARPAPRDLPAAATDRLRQACPSLAGIAALGALSPLRHIWAVDVVLLAVALTVPGVLALRALRVPAAALARYPILVPAAALAVLIAGGLIADLAGPPLGVTSPLHGYATAGTVLGLSLALWVSGLPAPAAARLPWREALRHPAWMTPLSLPLLAALGALALSNGGGPTLARVGQGLVAVTLLGTLFAARRLSRTQVAMLLFACGLAAEWAFSLRSHEVVGFDIATEIEIAQHTQSAGVWHSLQRGNAYGAMLSITILPSTLASLTGCSPLTAFKAVYPVLTALLPVSMFLIGERFLRRPFAAGAAALLLVQTYFFQLMPQLARQEIGLLFFAAVIGALVEGELSRRSRAALLALMACGLVVSHYSSVYLTIPIVALSAVISLPRARRPPGRRLLAGLACTAVTLIGGAGVWYVVVTHSAGNLRGFVRALEDRGLDLVPNGGSNLIAAYLNGTVARPTSAASFQRLAIQAYAPHRRYLHPLPQARQPRFALRPASVHVPPARAQAVVAGLRWLSILFGELMLALGVLGGAMMVVRRRGPPLVNHVGTLALSTVAVLVVIRFSGTMAANYNQTRALAQSLILLALPAAWVTQLGLDRLGRVRHVATAALPVAFALMFAYQSSLSAVLTGGGTLLNLSQRGEDFERQYMTPAELAAATWAAEASHRRLLYADPYGQLRLSASTGAVALLEVTPQTLDRHAWVYGTRTNVVLGHARGQVGEHRAIYAWPNRFLNQYFDTVFTDGDSRVYHR